MAFLKKEKERKGGRKEGRKGGRKQGRKEGSKERGKRPASSLFFGYTQREHCIYFFNLIILFI